VNLLRRKPAPEPAPQVEEPVVPATGKGRPTPKRRQAEGVRRGPVAPPPMTQREAVKRAKQSPTGKPLNKDEKRAMAAERRERMMRGDDAYVMPRDKGPARAYVRDLVDARRNLASLLLPFVLLSFLVLLTPVPVVQAYGPLVLFVALLAAVADSFFFGRQLSRKVAVKFPKGDPTGMSTKAGAMGFYAFNRACMPRRWRAPRPKVATGATVD
jgi:hypothetical protein